MEAPDKIYLRPLSDGETYNHWYRTDWENNCIEYIRADTFIEKAWDWIEDNVLSINQQDESRLYFEQFKKYTKGE